ncbi:MAG: succinate dehydrogenase, cytochrome b556 subunit [Pseudomonadota bacterium]|jgi:succinate dehydrogenase / fumarate reductase cytochrome b subunit|nr:succinate dehydrogenase, cytochrome b556 subunit [Burkholderiales bacterium]
MKQRPKFVNLFVLGPKMGITAKVSILHRLSGVLLVLTTPLFLYLLHQSLTNQHFYSMVYSFSQNISVKIIYILAIWAFIFHLCSGVRFLFLDMHKGIEIKTSRISATLVLLISTILTIIVGVILW